MGNNNNNNSNNLNDLNFDPATLIETEADSMNVSLSCWIGRPQLMDNLLSRPQLLPDDSIDLLSYLERDSAIGTGGSISTNLTTSSLNSSVDDSAVTDDILDLFD